MKKLFLKFLSLSLAISFLFSMLFINNISAMEDIDKLSSESFIGEMPSEIFKEYINDTFSSFDKVTVMSKNNTNITAKFFNDNIKNFTNRDYVKIKAYVFDNVDTICIDESTSNKNTRSPFVNQNVSKTFYKTIKKDKAAGEVQFVISGSFVWDRANYHVISTSNAKLNITYINFGRSWGTDINNISTNSKITNDKLGATFSGSFSIRATYSVGILETQNVDCGTVSGSVTGYPNE